MNKYLIDINDLKRKEILNLFKQTHHFVQNNTPPLDTTQGKICANLFFVNSTRTLNSFLIAQHKLGMFSLNPIIDHCALSKGETIRDMVQNIEAMGCSLFVTRHSDSNFSQSLLPHLSKTTRLISAGAGLMHHPTQALTCLLYTSPRPRD